jgi:hypothetical protein
MPFRRFWIVVAALFVVSCKSEPVKMTFTSTVRPDGLDLTVTWRKGSTPQPPDMKGKLDVSVTDDDVEVCKGSAPASAGTVTALNDLAVHVAMTCPPRKPKVARWAKATFTSADAKTTYVYSAIISSDEPAPAIGSMATPEIPLATKQANLTKALASVPAATATFEELQCPDDVLQLLPRKERVGLFTVLWDDAARALGVHGAGTLCKGVFAEPARALENSPRLLYVLRASSCIPTSVTAGKKEFSGGAIAGVTSIVDLKDGKVLCSARVTAESASTVHVYEREDPGSEVSWQFTRKVSAAEAAAIRRVSHYIDAEPSPIDPETR